LSSSFSPRELAFLASSSSSWSGGAIRQIVLLCMDQLFLMTPDLTIPHPDLHASARWLVPAAEIAPDFIHPVLGARLEELGQKLKTRSQVEFYAQSKALLDFSSAQN